MAGAEWGRPAVSMSSFSRPRAPAAYVDPLAEVDAKIHRGAWTYTADDLVDVRVVRVDANSRAGRWLALHGLPSQGVFLMLVQILALRTALRPMMLMEPKG